jgi:drug/metabolite transporter (DMT)-like permease
MLLILISTFLIGISTPLAALLIKDHDPLVFAFYFLFALLIIQLPFIFRKWSEIKTLVFKKEFNLLITGSLIATFQYWCEFSSLKVGLPVSHLAFLTLTVPTWVMFYEFIRGRGRSSSLNKVLVAIVGSLALIIPTVGSSFTLGHLLPIMTSFFMAAFLISSKRSQEAGISPLVISFFNDLLALIAISFIILAQNKQSLITVPENTVGIFLFAIIVGLLPGLTFLYGLRTTKLNTASILMVIEPIVFGIMALMVNYDELGILFYLGAILITLSTLPNFSSSVRKIRVIYALNMFK